MNDFLRNSLLPVIGGAAIGLALVQGINALVRTLHPAQQPAVEIRLGGPRPFAAPPLPPRGTPLGENWGG